MIEAQENDQSKYDRSHADEINEAYTFSFTGHFILPRSEPKAALPILLIQEKKAAKLATVRGMLVTLRRRGDRLWGKHRSP
jgi:hypothetical protein